MPTLHFASGPVHTCVRACVVRARARVRACVRARACVCFLINIQHAPLQVILHALLLTN